MNDETKQKNLVFTFTDNLKFLNQNTLQSFALSAEEDKCKTEFPLEICLQLFYKEIVR